VAKRLHVNFKGRVQGVGFRYTVRHLAEDFQVTGYVKNMPNGDVELVAEGVELDLKRFLIEIQERMGKYINRSLVTWTEANGEFNYFGVRF